MPDKDLPPPPVLPPTHKISEKFCLFHKGEIKGEIYICPKCKSQYCLECAKKAMNEGKICVKCKQIILV